MSSGKCDLCDAPDPIHSLEMSGVKFYFCYECRANRRMDSFISNMLWAREAGARPPPEGMPF